MKLKATLRDISSNTGKGNVKIAIVVKSLNKVFIPTEIYIMSEEWDKDNEIVINHTDSIAFNAQLFSLKEKYYKYNEDLDGKIVNPKSLKSAFLAWDKLKDIKKGSGGNDFIAVIDKLIYDLESEVTTEEMSRGGYASIMKGTKFLLIEYFKSKTIPFAIIDSYALIELKKYFLRYRGKEVTYNKHLRTIKKVFNAAIAQRLISSDVYPFRAISIPSDYDCEIKCIDIDTLRSFYTKSGIERDLFFLSFFLCGMNLKDMYYMPYFKDIIDIKRLKTIRTARAVKLRLQLQPEAKEIIERYADQSKVRMLDLPYKSHRNVTSMLSKKIRAVVEQNGYPKFSFTYVRHTWATIAGELGVPDSTIDKALMHSVTGQMIEKYRKYDYSQIDVANRKVIDYLSNNEKDE